MPPSPPLCHCHHHHHHHYRCYHHCHCRCCCYYHITATTTTTTSTLPLRLPPPPLATTLLLLPPQPPPHYHHHYQHHHCYPSCPNGCITITIIAITAVTTTTTALGFLLPPWAFCLNIVSWGIGLTNKIVKNLTLKKPKVNRFVVVSVLVELVNAIGMRLVEVGEIFSAVYLVCSSHFCCCCDSQSCISSNSSIWWKWSCPRSWSWNVSSQVLLLNSLPCSSSDSIWSILLFHFGSSVENLISISSIFRGTGIGGGIMLMGLWASLVYLVRKQIIAS